MVRDTDLATFPGAEIAVAHYWLNSESAIIDLERHARLRILRQYSGRAGDWLRYFDESGRLAYYDFPEMFEDN
jgi:hypothetical protein